MNISIWNVFPEENRKWILQRALPTNLKHDVLLWKIPWLITMAALWYSNVNAKTDEGGFSHQTCRKGSRGWEGRTGQSVPDLSQTFHPDFVVALKKLGYLSLRSRVQWSWGLTLMWSMILNCLLVCHQTGTLIKFFFFFLFQLSALLNISFDQNACPYIQV